MHPFTTFFHSMEKDFFGCDDENSKGAYVD